MPTLWNDTPFVVDISSALPNAYDLLAAVDKESKRIQEALGYSVFVAGQVEDFADLTRTELENSETGAEVGSARSTC